MLDRAMHQLGAFHLEVDRAGSGVDGFVQYVELLLDTAVETPVILVAAAGGENRHLRVLFEDALDGLQAGEGLRQIVETELDEGFAGLDFFLGVLKQRLYVGKPERDADVGKRGLA
jgi:hypothetical protein